MTLSSTRPSKRRTGLDLSERRARSRTNGEKRCDLSPVPIWERVNVELEPRNAPPPRCPSNSLRRVQGLSKAHGPFLSWRRRRASRELPEFLPEVRVYPLPEARGHDRHRRLNSTFPSTKTSCPKPLRTPFALTTLLSIVPLLESLTYPPCPHWHPPSGPPSPGGRPPSLRLHLRAAL
jgi:hypothetical protein